MSGTHPAIVSARYNRSLLDETTKKKGKKKQNLKGSIIL
jgi:hypothetical protein